MNPKLHWIAAPQASLPHAAAMLATGHTLADADLASQLSPIIAATDAELRSASISRHEFWANLVPASAGLASPASASLHEQLIDQLQTCDGHISSDELLLRAGPLRDAWEARGPGLWRSLSHLVQEPLPAPSASVILVRPVLGGGGMAFPQPSAISFEAMLANPQRELPEVVRLAWLVAQLPLATLAVDPRQTALALMPAILQAADDVELARCDLPTLRIALRAWHLESDERQCDLVAAKLWAWWQSLVREGRPLREVAQASRL